MREPRRRPRRAIDEHLRRHKSDHTGRTAPHCRRRKRAHQAMMRIAFAAIICLIVAAASPAEVRDVDVRPDDKTWVISSPQRKITLRREDFALTLTAGPATWPLLASGADDLSVQNAGQTFPLRFIDAKSIDIK